MMRVKILSVGLIILFSALTLSAQTVSPSDRSDANPIPDWVYRNQQNREQQNRMIDKDKNGMIANRRDPVNPPLVSKNREKENKELRKAFERTRKMIEVPSNYKAFVVGGGKLNLVRLQPDRRCYGKGVVSAEELERCADVVPIPGGGSLYSFSAKRHYPLMPNIVFLEEGGHLVNSSPKLDFGIGGDWWDIHFIDNKFGVGSDWVQGIMSEIGDVDLNEINLNSPSLKFLINYEPEQNVREVRAQNEVLRDGIKDGDFVYSNSAPVKVGSTYVLRSILYPFKPKFAVRGKWKSEGMDMMLAFKVVGAESDGSVILLWKEIKKEKLSQKSK